MAAEQGCEAVSSHTNEIAADGDVILIVGITKKRLRVRSVLLKSASKVFAAMLGLYFSEGQDICSDHPKEIPLPEDDVAAMQTICEVMHHRNDAASDLLASSDVLQVAIAANKYDCLNTLRYASAHWLKLTKPSNMQDLLALMAAAYLFDSAQAFGEITNALILDHKDSYIPLAQGEDDSILPWRVFCLLEERRGEFRTNLQGLLIEASTSNSSSCECGWWAKHAVAYSEELLAKNLLSAKMLKATGGDTEDRATSSLKTKIKKCKN